jgi:hypothetical protein
MVQLSLPDTFLNLPASHVVHCCPLDPVYPALHVQACASTLPTGEAASIVQFEHATDPIIALYVPCAQSVHVALPLAPVLPGRHWQSSSVAAPSEVVFFPEGQFIQVRDAEMSGLYFARAQRMHCVLSLEAYDPAEQFVQVFAGAPLVGRYFPDWHMVQLSLPDTFLNLPASHMMHECPLDPVYPALHVQASASTLPTGETAPIVQFEHATDPMVALYVPCSHSVHVALPLAPVLPATH